MNSDLVARKLLIEEDIKKAGGYAKFYAQLAIDGFMNPIQEFLELCYNDIPISEFGIMFNIQPAGHTTLISFLRKQSDLKSQMLVVLYDTVTLRAESNRLLINDLEQKVHDLTEKAQMLELSNQYLQTTLRELEPYMSILKDPDVMNKLLTP